MARFKDRRDVTDTLEEREKEKLRAMSESLPDFGTGEDDSFDVYEMALKKRSMAGILNQAMRDEGAGDMMKKIKWRKRHISGEET